MYLYFLYCVLPKKKNNSLKPDVYNECSVCLLSGRNVTLKYHLDEFLSSKCPLQLFLHLHHKFFCEIPYLLYKE